MNGFSDIVFTVHLVSFEGGNIMESLDMIMKDDQFIGDKIGCCPICGEHFHLPIELALSNNVPKSYPCSKCGQLINVK